VDGECHTSTTSKKEPRTYWQGLHFLPSSMLIIKPEKRELELTAREAKLTI